MNSISLSLAERQLTYEIMEIYFSTDVETDGPIPGPNSMLSLGSAAFSSSGKLLATFSVNLETLPGAEPDPSTQAWWEAHPEAYRASREGTLPTDQAMLLFSKWVDDTLIRCSGQGPIRKASPVFVGFPAGFDFLFVYWYLIKFTGQSPFSFSALDGKTYAMALLKTGYRQSTKRNYPKAWFPLKNKHTHIAVEDAIEQGHIFCSMLAANGQS
jgi:hypothetical protein